MLKKKYKLKNSHLFDKAFQKGCKVKGDYGILVGLRTDEVNHLQIGIVVSKKVSKIAVYRNKIKRRISTIFKENIKSNCLDQSDSLILVYVVFNSLKVDTEYVQLEKDIKKQLNKLLEVLKN